MNTLVMKCVFGSKLYGTDTPESDLDYKGIFIPSAKSLVLGDVVNHYSKNTSNSDVKNTANDIDEEMFSLKHFIEMAIKGETIALDMIHTPSELIVDYDDIGPWDFIYQNRSKLYTTDMKAYLGYVKKQAAKYGIKGTRMAALRQVSDSLIGLETEYYVTPKEALEERGSLVGHINCKKQVKLMAIKSVLPVNEYCFFSKCEKTGAEFYEVLGSKHVLTITLKEFKTKIFNAWEKYGERTRLAEQNQGIDWKSLHHAIRGGLQLKEIYSTGDLQYPLKDRDLLVQIKKGQISFNQVSELLNDLISEVDVLALEAYKNGMPKQVDTDFWDKFLFDVHSNQILNFLGK